jgi:serine/threonine-protein kinase
VADENARAGSLSMSAIPQELSAALAGDYDLIRELGEGGMAVVYLATDLKHNREVAIKVLKSDLAAVVGAERFLGEIETTAKLQHPNILPLFDSGAKDGVLYYAMPYVEGETLRERLKRESQLPVEDALDLIQKVAAALDYAHEKGIVHRDIKPANILLSSGEPLIADFGIALAVSQANDGRRTETGLSLGTPHYMSPEQAAGDRSLDPRSDVYALGCILQEMLTGEPPFSGANAQAVLARILTSRPTRVTSLRPTVPPHVEGVIAKALEKLPADRFKTAKDFRKALSDTEFRHVMTEHTIGTGSVPLQPATIVRRGAPTGVVAGLAAGLALMAAVALFGWLRPAPDEPVRRLALDLDVQTPAGQDFAVSPGGDRYAYLGEGRLLYVRSFGSLEDQEIPGSFEARGVIWSPDGTSLAFNADGGEGDIIYTAAVSGGSPIPIGGSEDTNPLAAWADDGYVYYQLDGPTTQTVRAPAQGGPAEPVLTDGPVFMLSAIPGVTDRLLVTTDGETGETVAILDLESGEIRPIPGMAGTFDPSYANGYLFWTTSEGAALSAARFDLEREVLTSVPVTLGRGLFFSDFSLSEAGVLMHRESGSGGAGGTGETLGWLERDGSLEVIADRLAGDVGDFDDVRLSADGRYVAYEMQRGGDASPDRAQRIQIYDLDQGTSYQLTFLGEDNVRPRWMPDGRVAYLSDQDGAAKIFAQPFDRSGAPELLIEFPDSLEILDFEVGPDEGAPILVTALRIGSEQNAGIFLADPADSGGDPVPFVDTPFFEWQAAISPDGEWVAYTSDENDREEVYVRKFPEGGRPWAVASEPSNRAAWAPTSDEVLYRTPDGFVSRTLDIGDEVRVTGREVLFQFAGLYEMAGGPGRTYDVASDGRLLVTVEPAAQLTAPSEGQSAPEIIVTFNVFREIEERLAQLEGGR